MSRSFERFKKDLLARVKQHSPSTTQEPKLLKRKFKYFDHMETGSCTYNDFSKVISRLNVICKNKNEEFEIFSKILREQKEEHLVPPTSKDINYVEFVHKLFDIRRSTKSRSNIRLGQGSTRNNTTSEIMNVIGSRVAPCNVTTSEFEKSRIAVSEGICEINLLYVLEFLNKEIKRGMGNRQIDYKGLLNCLLKIGLGFKYEVRIGYWVFDMSWVFFY
jgi:hypothetical protein